MAERINVDITMDYELYKIVLKRAQEQGISVAQEIEALLNKVVE